MNRRSLLGRSAAALILAGALTIGTAGCGFITPIATLEQYDPSDGIGATVGGVAVRNVIGLISEDGTQLSLLVTFVNTRDRSANIHLEFESDGSPVSLVKAVNARGTSSYGNTAEDPTILVSNPGVIAGDLFPVYVQVGDSEGTELLVPVRDGSLPEYTDLGPAGTGE